MQSNFVLLSQVYSDLGFVSGDPFLPVLPRQSMEYSAVFSPPRHGTYRGVLSFIAGEKPYQSVLDIFPVIDSDMHFVSH